MTRQLRWLRRVVRPQQSEPPGEPIAVPANRVERPTLPDPEARSRAGLLTAAPWHNSLGDIATARATQDGLAELDIAVRELPAASSRQPDECLVVGGGDLLSSSSGPSWSTALEGFLVPGPHVLNAVGLDTDTIDPGRDPHLREYRLVSVRDHAAAEFLTGFGATVSIVPCPATLTKWTALEELTPLPYHDQLRDLRPGEYVVVHRHPELEDMARRLDLPVVAVDMQIWTSHRWTADTIEVATHSPTVAMTLVRHARAVFTYSLHLAIFALGAGTPLAHLDLGDRQSRKVTRYLARAGLEGMGLPDPKGMPSLAMERAADVATVSRDERSRTVEHLRQMANAIR